MACDWGVGGRGAHREHAGSQAVRRLKVQAEEARPYLSLALEILDLKKKKRPLFYFIYFDKDITKEIFKDCGWILFRCLVFGLYFIVCNKARKSI